MRRMKIYPLWAKKAFHPIGWENIRFSAWPDVVSSMKRPRSCWPSFRLHTVSRRGSKGAESLSTTNVFRLETTGVAVVCLVYLDLSGPAHMRYSVRRLRRKLPKAIIILGCLVKDIDPSALEVLRDNAKADLAAGSLGETVKLCIEATGVEVRRSLQAGNVYNRGCLRFWW